MTLNSLTLSNFGPYKGTQTLAFPTDPGRSVLVVFGANMRGKTSLLNALRWALYGRALDRSAAEIDVSKLVNRDAAASGDWSMSVDLTFEAGGHTYRLHRAAVARDSVLTPKSSRDFDHQVHLQRDGDALSLDEIKRQVNRLLPEDISRFYLFDGELLQEYEALLREGSELGREIRRAIEQILGVPALLNGRDDLTTLYKEARKVLATDSKHVDALNDYVRQHNQLDAEVRELEVDLERLRQTKGGHTRRLQSIGVELEGTQAARAAERDIRAREHQRATLREQEDADRDLRLIALADAWSDLLQPRLDLRRETLSRDLDEAQQQLRDRGALDAQVQTIEDLLETGVCAVCESPVGDERQQLLGDRLGELRAQLRAVKETSGRLTELGADLKAINRLAPTGRLAEAARLERAVRAAVFRQEQLAGEIDDLKEQLRGHNMGQVRALQTERDGLQKLVGKAEAEIERTETALGRKQLKLKEVTRLMSQDPRARQRQSGRAVEVYDALQNAFEEGIGRLRDRLRSHVAEQATEAFRHLTTEDTYRSLRINPSYGLTIEDRDGHDVPLRSAGAEQVVALSLLSALNKTADRPGPVVMDTPFGRLDPDHRTNILRYVPELARQVVFLVHAGEIDPDAGLKPIIDHVGAIYDIERVSSSHSRLAPRS